MASCCHQCLLLLGAQLENVLQANGRGTVLAVAPGVCHTPDEPVGIGLRYVLRRKSIPVAGMPPVP